MSWPHLLSLTRNKAMKTKTNKTTKAHKLSAAGGKPPSEGGKRAGRDTKTAEFLTIYKTLTPTHRRVADALVVMLTVGIDAEKAKAAATEMGKMWCKDGAK